MGIGSVVGAGLGLVGSMNSADASKSAANTQAQATTLAAQEQQQSTDNQIAFQQQALAQEQANISPYLNMGNAALPTLQALLGLGGNGLPVDAIMASNPAYAFQQQQGTAAIEGSAAAKGMQLSGATLKQLSEFGQGLANQTYDQYYNRIAGVVGQGASAAGAANNAIAGSTNNITSALQTGASNINNLQTSGAAAEAAGTVGAANAYTSAANNINQQYTLRSILGGGAPGTQAPAPIEEGVPTYNPGYSSTDGVYA